MAMNYKGKAIPVSYDYLSLEQKNREENQRKSIEEQEALKRQDELISGQAIPLPSEAAFIQQNKVTVDKSSGLTFLDKVENSLPDLWRSAKMIPRAAGEMLAASPVGLVTDIVAGTANLALPESFQIPSTKAGFSQAADIIGLPKPTPDEQDILDVAGFAGGAELYRRGAQGLGKQLLEPKVTTAPQIPQQIGRAREVTGQVATELGKGTPGLTVAAGAGGGTGFVAAENQGATPAEAMLASVFGSGLAMLPATAVNELQALITGARTPQAQQMLKDRMSYWLSVVKDRAAIPASAVAPNRFTRSAEQSATNLAGGSGIMAETAEGVQGAVQQRVGEVSRELVGTGVEVNPELAGQAVAGIFKGSRPNVRKESWEYGYDKLIGKMYDAVERRLPKNFVVAPTNTLRVLGSKSQDLKTLPGVAQTPLMSNVELKETFKVFDDAVKANNGVASLDDIRTLRSSIGEKIISSVFGKEGGIDNATFKTLYASLSDDILKAIKDPVTKKLYLEANAKHSAELDTLTRIAKIVNSTGGGERLFDAVKRGAGIDSRLITDIYKRLPSKDRKLFTAAFMDEIIKAKSGKQLALEDVPSIRSFLTEYNNLKPNARSAIFGDPSFGKTYQKDMKAILQVMDDVEKQGGYLANPVGSGRVVSMAYSGGTTALGTLVGVFGGQSLTSAAVGAAFGIAPTLGMYGTAKVMTNPRFVRWLASGSKLPAKPSAINAWVSQLGVIAEKDEELREAHQAIKDALIKEQTEYKPKVPKSLEGRAVPYELQ
jgi:hypothetical protein